MFRSLRSRSLLYKEGNVQIPFTWARPEVTSRFRFTPVSQSLPGYTRQFHLGCVIRDRYPDRDEHDLEDEIYARLGEEISNEDFEPVGPKNYGTYSFSRIIGANKYIRGKLDSDKRPGRNGSASGEIRNLTRLEATDT